MFDLPFVKNCLPDGARRRRLVACACALINEPEPAIYWLEQAAETGATQ
jgi:hypothetical protein